MSKSLLQILKKPRQDTPTKVRDTGYAPRKSETGARAFIAKLRGNITKSTYGNDDAFKAASVTTFNRGANRYGHDNVDYNATDDEGQLQTARKPVAEDFIEVFEEAFNEFLEQTDLEIEEALDIFCEANELDREKFWIEEDGIIAVESNQNPAEFSAAPGNAEATASVKKHYTGGKKEGMEMQKLKRLRSILEK